MIAQLDTELAAALQEIPAVTTDAGLEELRLKYLGKKGTVTLLSGGMRDVPPDQKAAVGAKLNEARTGITTALEAKKAELIAAAEAAEAKAAMEVKAAAQAKALADAKAAAEAKAAEAAKKVEAEAVLKKLLASGMSADEILEKLK